MLFKKSEGFFQSWEGKYFILDSRSLYWYQHPDDKASAGVIKLSGCYISEIKPHEVKMRAESLYNKASPSD